MYRQVAEDLRRQIESGELPAGRQLPSQLNLQQRYSASRNTISDAIKWLTSVGLVETRPGQGTFVIAKVDPFVTILSADPGTGFGGGEGATYLSQVGEQHRSPSTGPVRVEIQDAPAEVAARLRVPNGTQVVVRHQERYIDGTPWSLQTSFYPMKFVTSGDADRLMMATEITEGTVLYLKKAVGLQQVGYRDWITARAPVQNEMSFFGLPHDGMVYVIFRTAFDQDGRPMRLTVTVFPIDRNQFIVNVGDVPEPQYGAGADEAGP